MITIEPGTTHWFHKGFREHFPELKPGDYIDQLMLRATGKVTIDILRFDDYLHKKHGAYEKRGLSMKILLVAEYSQAAADFVESVI